MLFRIRSIITRTIRWCRPKRFEFGVRQMTEEILSEKYQLCSDGRPVEVTVLSIEAPTTGVQVGPFEFKQKKTIVKTKVVIVGK